MVESAVAATSWNFWKDAGSRFVKTFSMTRLPQFAVISGREPIFKRKKSASEVLSAAVKSVHSPETTRVIDAESARLLPSATVIS